MNRRKFMNALGIGAAAFATGQLISCQTEIKKKPNIIYIMTDDLGYGDVSCYGQSKFQTPNIDKLANEGMRFTQHYSGSTVCAPSRCCLMTGLHTGHAQIRGNKEHKPVGQFPMKDNTVTVAGLLQKSGYTTGAFGKWGLGYPGSTGDPNNQGFDTFYGYNCQRTAHSYYPKWLYHNDKKIELDGKTYAHDLIMSKAMEFIKDNKDNPFFCYLPVTIPHASMHAPKDKHKEWKEKLPEFNAKIGKYSGPDVENPIAAFPAMVTHMDEQIGEIMKLLQELNIADNTIVIFTSDNGPHREGGHDPEFWNSNGSLRGIKRDLYEGGIRVPMIARWHGKIKAGQISNHISAFWDIMPTFCDIAEIETPKNIDGISFLPELFGNEQEKHEYLYWEFLEQGGKQAVLMENWKGVRLNVHKNNNAPIELYNLKADMAEQNNVAADYPEIINNISNIMMKEHVYSEEFSFKYEKK